MSVVSRGQQGAHGLHAPDNALAQGLPCLHRRTGSARQAGLRQTRQQAARGMWPCGGSMGRVGPRAHASWTKGSAEALRRGRGPEGPEKLPSPVPWQLCWGLELAIVGRLVSHEQEASWDWHLSLSLAWGEWRTLGQAKNREPRLGSGCSVWGAGG